MIRILLADDHKIMREGLKALLDKQPNMEVVGEASDGRSAIALARRLAPDVVLMDVAMPDLNGVDATRQILSANSGMKVIGLSMHSDALFVAKMLEAGASGYVLKDCAFEEVVTAIDAVAKGRIHLCREAAEVAVGDYVRNMRGAQNHKSAELTPREREVLQLIAEGKDRRQIGSRLHVSVKTVDTHRRNAMVKLNLHSTAELTRYAIHQGLSFLP